MKRFSTLAQNSLKKHFAHIAFFTCLIVILTGFSHIAQAQPALPDPGLFINKSSQQLENVEGTTAQEKLNYLVRQNLIPIAKFIFISVSILLFVVYGLRLVVATEEEEVTRQRDNLLYAVIGFGLLGIATHIVDALDPGSGSGIGQEEELITGTRLLILYAELIIGTVASAIITIAGFRIITSQGNEEEVSKEKAMFTWGAVALMIVMLAETIVSVVYRVQGTEAIAGDAEQAVAEIAGILSFILQFLAILSVISLLLSGAYMVTSAGNEDQVAKAKTMIIASVVAIGLIFTSYAFVATFLQ